MTVNNPNLLRWGRIVLAILIITVLTAASVSQAMTVPRLAGFLSKIQFIPAAMAFSVTTIIVILIMTLFFGRIYCSTVCPLGTFQDIFARLVRLGKNSKKREYHYCEPFGRIRNLALFFFAVSLVLGISFLVSTLDPYGLYSRFCTDVLRPLWLNVEGLFGIVPVKIASASLVGMISALVIVGIIGIIATRRGRLYCNTICPVGTTLGYISRYSIFKIDINTDKCIQCRNCEHVCKSQCIDLTSHVVDMSRCVSCFDCLPVCPNDAIHFTSTRHQLSFPLMMRSGESLAGSAVGMDGPVDLAAGPETSPEDAGAHSVKTHKQPEIHETVS